MPRTINTAIEDVALNRLKVHPRNANQGDFGAIQESIQANGFYGTVVANKRTGCILAGNHRFLVAKEEGFDTIPVAWVDVDEEEEIRILVADNRTTRLGLDDTSKLSEILAELAVTDRGLTGTGFDGEDLDRLIADLARSAGDPVSDPLAEWQGMPDFEQPDVQSVKQIIVHFKTLDDVQLFSDAIGQSLTEKTKYCWFPEQEKQEMKSFRCEDES